MHRNRAVGLIIQAGHQKYLKCWGCWQFAAGLKVEGLPEPAYVVIDGEGVKEPSGGFYLEWRIKTGFLNGTIGFEPEEIEIPVSKRSIRSAFDLLISTASMSASRRCAFPAAEVLEAG